MNIEEQKTTNIKKCNRCKNELDISHFIRDNNEFSVCDICINHIKTKNLRNICHICGKWASFNIPELKYGRFCNKHKETDMVDTKHKKCVKCAKKYPIFNNPNETVASHCGGCKEIDMINIKSKKCIKCQKKLPIFNNLNETVATHCGDCKEIGMIDIIHPKCTKCNIKRPLFNNLNETVATHCKDCKEVSMTNIKSKKCIKCNKKHPIFNNSNETVATHCWDCKEVGMIDIKNKKCIKCNKKQPYFNNSNETIATHCGDCKELDMIDIKHHKCIKCNVKIPSFNKVNETIASHCGDCKELDMIDIRHSKCIKCNIKRPLFNKPNETVASHCGDCKENGMIDIKNKKCIKCGKKHPNFNNSTETVASHCGDCKEADMTDVKHKKCIIDNCNTRSLYGYCGQSPIYCGKHRDLHTDKNFLYKQPKRICIGNDEEDCKNISEYGKTEPIHCLEHKIEDDIYLVAQKCTQCCNNDLLNKEGLCITYCAPNKLYQQVKQEKKKEKLVLSYLDTYVKIENIINIQDDRIINTFCNHYRPDRMYDIGTHCIIIEVDEDQHKGKRASCSKGEIGELARMHEIQNAIGINCIFLRFNPDSFKVNGKLHKININERLKLLVKWIEKCVDMKPTSHIQPVKYKYLFYDEWSDTDTIFKEIDDTELYDK
jgi:thiol-disulfide isomerase/thioredoxin